MRKLKPDAVPSIFKWTQKWSPADAARTERAARRQGRKRKYSELEEIFELSELSEHLVEGQEEECQLIASELEVETTGSCEAGVQTEPVEFHQQESVVKEIIVKEVMKPMMMNLEMFEDDPEGMQYYFGLASADVFRDVLFSLGPDAHRLTYYQDVVPQLSVENQLLMVLLKLRHNRPIYELGKTFACTEKMVYALLVTWIRFMSLQWREIDIWPSKDMVRFYSPLDFKKKFPTTRVVVDGAEMPIKKPAVPLGQQVTFSTYKNRNTAKVLVGVTPGGLVSFVSDAFGGAASDRQIVERSTLLNSVEPKDSIMADKGFDVQDIFAPLDVAINIPTFFKKKNRMNAETVARDRKVSSKRVHVERIIRQAKTYKILCQPLNHTETLLASDIIFICFMLTNFRKCIVPRTA